MTEDRSEPPFKSPGEAKIDLAQHIRFDSQCEHGRFRAGVVCEQCAWEQEQADNQATDEDWFDDDG